MTSDSAEGDTVLALIHMLSNRIGRAFQKEIEGDHGRTVAEWRVLLTLAQFPGASAIEITDRWAMDKMAVNRAIRRLVDAGHLRRRPNPDDRRSFHLSMTPKGKRLYARILPAANERYREIVACLSKQELAGLRAALKTLLDQTETLGR